MNETIRKFGYPATLVRDYEHWLVLLRPQQPTLGSLVLASKSDATAFGALEPQAFAELGLAVADLEAALKGAVGYEKVNYLMLMMVDRNVHFHVIPRYEGQRSGAGLAISDSGWPKQPALNEATSLDEAQIAAMLDWLKPFWS